MMNTDTTTTTGHCTPSLLDRAKAFHNEIADSVKLLRDVVDAAARGEMPAENAGYLTSLIENAEKVEQCAAAFHDVVADEQDDSQRRAASLADSNGELGRAQAAFEHWIGHLNGAALLVRATGHQAASSQLEPPALFTIADLLEEAADRLVEDVGAPLKRAAERAP